MAAKALTLACVYMAPIVASGSTVPLHTCTSPPPVLHHRCAPAFLHYYATAV